MDIRHFFVGVSAAMTACSAPPLSAPAASSSPLALRDGAVWALEADRGALAQVRPDTREIAETTVGREPARLALFDAGALVTLRAERSLAIVKDGAVEKIEVGAEPFGVVASTDRAYVATITGGEVAEVDLAAGRVTRRFAVPGQPRGLALHPDGRWLYVTSSLGGRLSAIDLAREEVLEVPLPSPEVGRGDAVFARRITGDPVVAPDRSAVFLPALFADAENPIDDDAVEAAGYDGDGKRFNPAVLRVPIDADGAPEGDPTISLFAEDIGYPTALAFAPDGTRLAIAFEGSTDVLEAEMLDGSPMTHAATHHVATPGIDGLTYGEDGWFGRGFTAIAGPESSTELPSAELDPRIVRGRQLFYTAEDSAMSRLGLSCATCHFEGRTDGLTWRFVRGPRQTPSLAEEVSATAPVRWEGDRASVADDAVQASLLMGGRGLRADDAAAIQAFVDSVRGVDLPRRGASDAAIERGRAIFLRDEVGCAGCHTGTLYTDKARHEITGGESLKTPSLLGVAATPPFLHDGSIETLEALVERAESGFMGDTSSLDAAERADLVAFLESL